MRVKFIEAFQDKNDKGKILKEYTCDQRVDFKNEEDANFWIQNGYAVLDGGTPPKEEKQDAKTPPTGTEGDDKGGTNVSDDADKSKGRQPRRGAK